MTGKITIHRSKVVLLRKHRWWPFGAKAVREVTICGCVHGPDGATGDFELTLPPTEAHRVGIGQFVVPAVERTGDVLWTKRDHHKHEA